MVFIKKINVLSLFDGMSCGQIALEKLGIEIDTYYASEIKEDAIKVFGLNEKTIKVMNNPLDKIYINYLDVLR